VIAAAQARCGGGGRCLPRIDVAGSVAATRQSLATLDRLHHTDASHSRQETDGLYGLATAAGRLCGLNGFSR
jgi:hypothetical protein